MKKVKFKIILVLFLFIIHNSNVKNENIDTIITDYSVCDKFKPKFELLYDNVIGTYYNAVPEQTNNNPTLTGSNKKIDINKASELRWIAISQVMLDCNYRANIAKDDRFKGKIQYGDTVWVDSPYPEINGWWVVEDAMNKRYVDRIDFLQTLGDSTLKRGKFNDIKIYRLNNMYYSELES